MVGGSLMQTGGQLDRFLKTKEKMKEKLANMDRILTISEIVKNYKLSYREALIMLEILRREGFNVKVLKLPNATLIFPPKVDLKIADQELIEDLFGFRILKEGDNRIIIETEYSEILDDLTRELSKFLEKFEEEKHLIPSPGVG